MTLTITDDDPKMKRAFQALAQLETSLDKYTFAGTNEAQVQKQVLEALRMERAFSSTIMIVGSEVISEVGRYDVLVDILVPKEPLSCRVVVELKVKGTAEAAERQAQRYAKSVGIDAVVIAATSARLMRNIRAGTADKRTLGGKPLGLIYLRPF
jgi:hypothetical protein